MDGKRSRTYRRSRKQKKTYRFSFGTQKRRKLNWPFFILAALFLGILLFSGYRLVSYALDYYRSQRVSKELRDVYYTPEEEPPLPTETPAPSQTAALLSPSSTPSLFLSPIRYPTNYYARISSRFQKLQRQNEDIIGWLTIEEMIDEAVVQRNNTYYLNRDYLGYHNVNGAIFLDESCNLKTRPYTLMLYGHNMKTGAMFGSLRKYENLPFYKNNAFITFDTAYETGRYVIFSIATVSSKTYDRNFTDFAKLLSSTVSWRQEAIDSLKKLSIHYSFVDVVPEDQLLLLVTCVEDDAERRVIAARRIRDGESEEDLKTLVNKSFAR